MTWDIIQNRFDQPHRNSVRLKGVIQALIIIDMEDYGKCDASTALLNIASELIEGISDDLDLAIREAAAREGATWTAA